MYSPTVATMISAPDTATTVLSQLELDSPLFQHRREHDRWSERGEQRNVDYTGDEIDTLLVALSVRCRARGHHGGACYLLFPQVERLLRSLLTPADRIAGPRNRALAVPSAAIMRTTMGAVIERLRSMYHAQPAVMRLMTLAAALTPIRDLCAHGVVTLVDPVDSISVRELSDALYLVVLLVETWSSGGCSAVEAVLVQHEAALQAQLTRLLGELQRSPSPALPASPPEAALSSPETTPTASAPSRRVAFTQQQEQRIRAEMDATLSDPCSHRASLVSLCNETTFSHNEEDRNDNGYPKRMLSNFIAECCAALATAWQSSALGESVDQIVALACTCVELATHVDMKDASGVYNQVTGVRDCIQQHLSVTTPASRSVSLTSPLTLAQLQQHTPVHNPQTELLGSLTIQLLAYRVQVNAEKGKAGRGATRLAAVDDVLVLLAPLLLNEAQDQLVVTLAHYGLLVNRAASAQSSQFDISGESELYRMCCRVLACPSVEATLRDRMAQLLRVYLDKDVLGRFSPRWMAGAWSATAHCETVMTLIRQLRFLCWQFDFLNHLLPMANRRLQEAIRITTSAAFNERQGFQRTSVDWQFHMSEVPGADSVPQLERVLLSLLPSRQQFTALQQHLRSSAMTLRSANPMGPDSDTNMEKAKVFYSHNVLLPWSQTLLYVLGTERCSTGETKVPRPLLFEFIRSCCADPAVERCAVNWLQQALVHVDSVEPDCLAALHVLLPGLEWIVRLLLRPAPVGGRRGSPSPDGAGCRVVDLPTMLRDWQSTSAVRGAPDFFVEHLQLLLVDDRGTQLRGRVEHGLLSADHSDDHTINPWILSFFSVLHAYLLCCVLLRDGPVAQVSQAPLLDMCHRAGMTAIDATLLAEQREMMRCLYLRFAARAL